MVDIELKTPVKDVMANIDKYKCINREKDLKNLEPGDRISVKIGTDEKITSMIYIGYKDENYTGTNPERLYCNVPEDYRIEEHKPILVWNISDMHTDFPDECRLRFNSYYLNTKKIKPTSKKYQAIKYIIDGCSESSLEYLKNESPEFTQENLDSENIKTRSSEIALNTAKRLISEGKKPYISLIRGKEAEGVGYREILKSNILKDINFWQMYIVCCCEGTVYDPQLGRPLSIDHYMNDVFKNEIDMMLAKDTNETIEIIKKA